MFKYAVNKEDFQVFIILCSYIALSTSASIGLFYTTVPVVDLALLNLFH